MCDNISVGHIKRLGSKPNYLDAVLADTMMVAGE
jgi:hypothetical protein